MFSLHFSFAWGGCGCGLASPSASLDRIVMFRYVMPDGDAWTFWCLVGALTAVPWYSLLCGLTLVRSCGPRLGHPAAPETQIPLHHVSQAGLRTGDATPRAECPVSPWRSYSCRTILLTGRPDHVADPHPDPHGHASGAATYTVAHNCELPLSTAQAHSTLQQTPGPADETSTPQLSTACPLCTRTHT